MLIKTLEEYREHKQAKRPLFFVRWLPFIGSPFAIHDRGTEEHVYTTIEEARDFFDKLQRPESCVESASLHRMVYPAGGGWSCPTIDEWATPPSAHVEE